MLVSKSVSVKTYLCNYVVKMQLLLDQLQRSQM